MRIFGIDPGLSGALAVLENKNVIEVIDLPVMAEGKKNKRHEKIETDWKTYTSSSNELNKDLETLGKDNFKFEILRWCDSKWELSYYEARLQFKEEVLLRNDYYNGIINVRIGGRK